MVGEHPTQTTLPGEDMKPTWRVACRAYRKVRQSGELDHPAWLALEPRSKANSPAFARLRQSHMSLKILARPERFDV